MFLRLFRYPVALALDGSTRSRRSVLGGLVASALLLPINAFALDFTFEFSDVLNGSDLVTGIVRGLTEGTSSATSVEVLTNTGGFGIGEYIGTAEINTWTVTGGVITGYDFVSIGSSNAPPAVTNSTLAMRDGPGWAILALLGSGGAFNVAPITFTAVLEPQVLLTDLIVAVEDCVAGGDLKASHGRALTNKLESALKKLGKDDIVAVVEKLNGFIAQVASLEAEGLVATDKANALIGDAQAILNAVQGPGKSSPIALRPTAEKSSWSTMKALYR